ncbi:sulfur carrier protein ThiS [Mycolicibacterium sp. CBM1]
MKVMVNDEEMELAADTTVTALLASLGLPERGIAVAVNWTVLPRSEWDSVVPEGARVDVVTAVQGG